MDTAWIFPARFQSLLRLHTVIEVFVLLASPMPMPITSALITREATKNDFVKKGMKGKLVGIWNEGKIPLNL